MNAPGWKAGAACVAITPAEPMWLAGWAARRQPAKEAAMPLFAKALALEDAAGARVAIVTADLIAVPRTLAEVVAARVGERWGIARERILFNASHTHTAPEVRPDKAPFFDIPPDFAAKIPGYVSALETTLLDLVGAALGRLAPASLQAHTTGATFAANRRSPSGPVDHEVPVLFVTSAAGKPIAVMFGYACHNLTLPPEFCAYHGDYAGVAQAVLEERFPGATALFLAGAGADLDPAPRGSPELAATHGHALADAVSRTLLAPGRAIAPTAGAGLENVVLDLQPLPPPDALQADLRSADTPRRRKAAFLLGQLDEKRPLAATHPCPVQVLRLGRELLLIALGGEPVVDFALQFKRELAAHGLVWVAGYSNDMFGYLPTRRVQQEGGYEAGRAALWSALPMPIGESSEERVVAAVRRLVSALPAPGR